MHALGVVDAALEGARKDKQEVQGGDCVMQGGWREDGGVLLLHLELRLCSWVRDADDERSLCAVDASGRAGAG